VLIVFVSRAAVFNFFFTCLGRVYALTILGNFLVGIPEWKRDEPTLGFPTHVDGSDANMNSVMFRLPDMIVHPQQTGNTQTRTG
jgi:hypothetical protein